MKHLCLFVVVILGLLSTFTGAQNVTSSVPPVSASISSSIFPDFPVVHGFSVQQFIEGNAQIYHIPGSVAVVFMNGEIVDTCEYGQLSIKDKVAARKSTPFVVGGLTKTITFAALLQLLEKGRFHLDQDINEFLQLVGWKINHPWYPTSIITFRHLLLHQSGIRDNWDFMKLFYEKDDPTLPLSEVINRYFVQVGGPYWSTSNWFRIPPGGSWKYSHMATTLAAYLLELIQGGQPFNEYCEENIFKPLGMHNTHFFYSEYKENISRVAYPHVWNEKLSVYKTVPLYGFADYPDGGLKTSVEDYFKFMSMLMNGGIYQGTRILSTASVDMMTTLQPILGQYDRQTYGMWNIFKKRSVVGHDGGERGWRSFAGFDPKTKNGLIWFSNIWPRCECMVSLAESIFNSWFGPDTASHPDNLAQSNALVIKPTANTTDSLTFTPSLSLSLSHSVSVSAT